METILSIGFFLAAWIFGIIVGSFFLIQPLIILFFALPTTIRLNKSGLMQSYTPLIKYSTSFFLLSGLFALSTWIVFSYFPTYKIPYLIGVGITLLMSFSRLGVNEDNLSNFYESNRQYLNTGPSITENATESDEASHQQTPIEKQNTFRRLVEMAHSDTDQETRKTAQDGVKALFPGGVEGFEETILKFTDGLKDPEKRNLAALALIGMGEMAIPYVQSLLEDANPEVRRLAIHILVQIDQDQKEILPNGSDDA
jgi:hypothetical protein